MRRILQVSTELQDAKDTLILICRPPRLSPRQLELLTSTAAGEAAEVDPSIDPSVRFFGLDWQTIFGKCFSLTLNLAIFRQQVLGSDSPLDLVLLNTLLKDINRIEVDVTSHGEAVLNGRLSKSQQLLIHKEQSKFSSLAVPAPYSAVGGNNTSLSAPNGGSKLAKSKSFRETGHGAAAKKARQPVRYKKNKTTDFNKLTTSSTVSGGLSAHAHAAHNGSSMSRGSSGLLAANCDAESRDKASLASEWEEVMKESTALVSPKRKTSFIQNVSSLFKNIR